MTSSSPSLPPSFPPFLPTPSLGGHRGGGEWRNWGAGLGGGGVSPIFNIPHKIWYKRTGPFNFTVLSSLEGQKKLQYDHPIPAYKQDILEHRREQSYKTIWGCTFIDDYSSLSSIPPTEGVGMGNIAWLDPLFSSFLCVRIWDEGQPITRTIITQALLPPSIYSHGMGLGSLAGWVFSCPLFLPFHRRGCGTWDGRKTRFSIV